MSGALPVFGVTGWKNSGKTTLVAALIAEFVARGYRVAAVKHAHHEFDIDHEGRDSHKYRLAGAREVAVVSARRWALMTELRNEPEPDLDAILKHLEGSDLVLVEGFKANPHPKIELRRLGARRLDPIAPDFPGIVAIASDHPLGETNGLPVFDLNDVPGIADFIARHLRLAPRRQSA